MTNLRPRSRPPATLILSAVLLCSPLCAADERLAIRLVDYAAAPITGQFTTSGNAAYHARINFLKEEPTGSGQLFINDLNGPLHTFSTQRKTFTTRLDFNGRGSRPGMFDKFTYDGGYSSGLIAFEFDPDYAHNGIFYTIHLEEPGVSGSSLPNNDTVPGLDTTGYTITPFVPTAAGPTTRHAVLIEWTDTNMGRAHFEGTAREILRIGYVTRIHTLGDMTFNPNATDPSHPDWRVLYLASGDGGTGESNHSDNRTLSPQRLDSLEGKTLRIIPDPALHPDSSFLSANGRYRIPHDNPFTDLAGARPEIWSYGHRNPHRLSWDAESDQLIVCEIGQHTWEEINLIHRGGNYGYASREGPERLIISQDSLHKTTGPLPVPDLLPVRINATVTNGEATPLYPVVAYRTNVVGDAIASGFVYRGSRIPELVGKFVFGDVTTGKLFYADYAKMLAADDGDPTHRADYQILRIEWLNPYADPAAHPERFEATYDIVKAAYQARFQAETGHTPPGNLPGFGNVAGGRADIRLATDAAGELYLLSKSDGMIREFHPLPSPPAFVVQPTDLSIEFGQPATFSVEATGVPAPALQWERRASGADTFLPLAEAHPFSGVTTASLFVAQVARGMDGHQFRCVAHQDDQSALSEVATLSVRIAAKEAWLTQNFSFDQLLDPEVSGDSADPDGDGIVNLLEYAFELNPHQNSRGGLPTPEADGAAVRIVFQPLRADLAYLVEASDDLLSWHSDGVLSASLDGIITATYHPPSGDRAFLRIRVRPRP